MGIGESFASTDYLQTDEPDWTSKIENGQVPANKVRGKSGTFHKLEDMVAPQDQALLEWSNIEFYVPVKEPTPLPGQPV